LTLISAPALVHPPYGAEAVIGFWPLDDLPVPGGAASADHRETIN
jgi:hypothetical protein